jgi:hypothetical protein
MKRMWRRGGRGRGRGGNQGPYPGHGPFSHLPPWQRPGWLYGPGSCWYLYRQKIETAQDSDDFDLSPFPVFNTCENCNAPLLPNANYCAQCGTKVDVPAK